MLHRRWNLLDALIIVPAIAMGLGSARWWHAHPGYATWQNAQGVSETVAWLLLPLSPALVAIRLRKPRPRWRRILRQPGFQANIVICLAPVPVLLNSRWGERPDLPTLPLEIGLGQVGLVGPMLAAGWLLTALAGARRPEPGMIDRMGRAVGWAWVVLWVSESILHGRSIVWMWMA